MQSTSKSVRQFLFVWACLAIQLGITSVWPRGCPAADRPNIVMIFTDDQGWHDVGCYGSEIPTPNIDALSERGMKFTQFYAASSICTPSRYGLLTGRFPTRSHDQLLSALMFLSPDDAQRGIRTHEPTYVEHLARAGYTTALVGKWHLGHGGEQFWPTNHGFESFFGHTGGCVDFFSLHYGTHPDWYRGRELVSPGTYATQAITDEALDFLQRQSSAREPFYLHVAYNAPHFGKAGNMQTGEITNTMQPQPSDLELVPKSIDNPLRRAFAAKVMGMDRGIGQIMASLEQLDLAGNTCVIFMTDHGGDPKYGGSNHPLRGGKATLFEGGLRVPCIVRWPQRIQPGAVCDRITCAIDVFPTVCELAGAADTPKTDGFSWRSLWTQSEHTQAGAVSPTADSGLWNARVLLWRTGTHQELSRKSWTAIRRQQYKIVRPPEGAPLLFDLSQDPRETTDLAAQKPELVRELLDLSQNMLRQHRPTPSSSNKAVNP